MKDQIQIGIAGMTCASCVARIERALSKLPGVDKVAVNLANESASLSYDADLAQPSQLAQTISDAGYHVVAEDVQIPIAGMTCASCVRRVERALGKARGVIQVSVNLATEKANVRYIAGMVSMNQLCALVEKAGYQVLQISSVDGNARQRARQNELEALRRSLIFAVLLTVPVLLIAMGPMVFDKLALWMVWLMPMKFWNWLQFLLATPVQLVAGRRFYIHGWSEIRHLNPGMNSLVLVSTSAAYCYSVLALIAPDLFPAGSAHLYFESAAVIISLILLGRYMETKAKGRTSEAITKLVRLQPVQAHVERAGEFVDVAAEELMPGDKVLVKPGESIPVDGVVLEGHSYIDESMVTGESTPAAKMAGSEVIAGTINKAGSFSMRAERVGAETVLANIIKMVEEAQSSKPPVQRLADRIAMVFVPAVIVVALITFAIWLAYGQQPSLNFAFIAAVSVLVIACPCAMGLATPTAIMVSAGKAAEMGILFRRGAALETLAKVDTVILDKTGTLTKGTPELTDVIVYGASRTMVMCYIAAVEAHSEHPLAQAVVDAAQRAGIVLPAVDGFAAHIGYGVEGRVDGRSVLVGSARFLDKYGVPLLAAEDDLRRVSEEAKTPVFCAIDGDLVAMMAVSDPLKSGAQSTVSALSRMGKKVMMVTGDRKESARAIARQAGIDQILAEVLPEDKASEVKKLQAEGGRVAFVGDGINDAPALSQADVGIAIGTGTDIAIEAGDVILMSGDLRGIVNAIGLSKRTLRTIEVNFFWAYAYNVILVPVAAGALYPFTGLLLNPMFAAAAMSASSLLVVSNSLRLKKFRSILPSQVVVDDQQQTAAALLNKV